MKFEAFLVELASLDHYPADFDPFIFKEFAERFFLSDPTFELDKLLEFIDENDHVKQPVILWSMLLAVLNRLYEEEAGEVVVGVFNKWYQRWVQASLECSCMRKLFIELTVQLINKRVLEDFIIPPSNAVKHVLKEETNVDMRRCLGLFLTAAASNYSHLDEFVVKPLFIEFDEIDHSMVIDEVASILLRSTYLQRMTDAEKAVIHRRLKGTARPGLVYLKLAAKIYQTTPDKISSYLNESFVNSNIPALVAYEILKLDDVHIPRGMLLKWIASKTTESVDNLVECLEEHESCFPEEVGRVRHDIIGSLPNVRRCSTESLIKFLNYLRLADGVISKFFIQAFLAVKSRIQRDPDLLDTFIIESDDLVALLNEPTVRKAFDEITLDVLKAEHSFNWFHTDSAIAILDRIANYFEYDEQQVNEQISQLVYKNTEELDYVCISALKFLFKHAPKYVMGRTDELFMFYSNVDLRVTILDRLLFTMPKELPPKTALNRILDDVIQLESNEEVQTTALRLAKKLCTIDKEYQSRLQKLKELVEVQTACHSKKDGHDVDELLEMVQTAKIHPNCYNNEVSKECY